MFSVNEFKKQVKQWMSQHPTGQLQDLIEYCEELIPSSQYAANRWLIEQTSSWYKHILTTRELSSPQNAFEEEE